MNTWKRIDPGKDPRGRGYGNTEPEDLALVRRCYGQDGKKWPRLTIAIYPIYSLNIPYPERIKSAPIGFDVYSAFKEKLNDAWYDDFSRSFIPIELYSDLLEMLEEAKNIIESKK